MVVEQDRTGRTGESLPTVTHSLITDTASLLFITDTASVLYITDTASLLPILLIHPVHYADLGEVS